MTMWLDRLSGHSAPGPHGPSSQPAHSRTFSPAPRRTSYLSAQKTTQRPGFSPRASSLSLVSNDSTTSLLASAQKTNGSGLKQSAMPPDYPGPLEVLEKLLASEVKDDIGPVQNGVPEPADDSPLDLEGAEDIEFGNLNLYYFALDEYERFENLHKSITECDSTLNSVELNLTSFQNDLGAVSAEIETLQARSTALSLRLQNRKIVEKGLGPVVEEITISPAVIKKISEGNIDEAWVAALAEVEKRSKSLDAKTKELRNFKGIADLKPLLEQLVNKAVERIRDFWVAQIKALRSPNINAQIIQQQNFIRYKDLFAFLWKHHEVLAEEIGQAYMNTMRWYYLNHFTRYEKALAKVRLHLIDKHDVLGGDDGSRRSTLLSSSKAAGPPHDIFNLGRRNDILTTSNQSALPSHLAEEDKSTHYLEFPFRNFNLALLDNASAEYSFLLTFFTPALTHHHVARYFNYIFAPTFELGHTLTRSLTSETVDCLGLLICVRLNQKFNFKLQHHKIPVADGYVNGTNMLLWPRFQVIMDQHCESVRKLTSTLPSSPPTSKSELAKQSAAPHYLTQRFGQFMQGILELSKQAGDDEPVSTSLARLRTELEAFLSRVAKAIADKRKRERFLENNYSLVLTIVGDEKGKLAVEQRRHFEELKGRLEGN